MSDIISHPADLPSVFYPANQYSFKPPVMHQQNTVTSISNSSFNAGLPSDVYFQEKNFSGNYFPDGKNCNNGLQQNVIDNQDFSSCNVAFTNQELFYYQQLYSLLDKQGIGYIDGNNAALFLKKSNLSNESLHEIWELADPDNSGKLTPENFYIACRLVSHAQNNLPVTGEVLSLDPIALPIFDNTPQPHLISQDVMKDGMINNSDIIGRQEDFPFDYSPNEMNNITCNSIVETMDYLPSITDTEKKKYIDLFYSTDSDGDGYVDGSEVKTFFTASLLQDSDLMRIWDLADSDKDGKLNLNEFILFMHLVYLRRYKFAIPLSLPNNIRQILHDNSLLTQGFSNGTNLGQNLKNAMNSNDSNLEDIMTNKVFFADSEVGNNRGILSSEERAIKSKLKKKKKKDDKIKNHESEIANDTVSYEDLSGNEVIGANDEVHISGKISDKKSRKKQGSAKRGKSVSCITFGSDSENSIDFFSDNNKSHDNCINYESSQNHLDSSATLFESVIEADKLLSKAMTKDIDQYAEDIERLNEVSTLLKAELSKEKSELTKLHLRKKEFQKQVEEARMHLEKLKEVRRKFNLVRVSLHRDNQHYQEDIIFLKQEIDDSQKDLQMLYESNEMLDKTYKQSENQIKVLDSSRKSALNDLKSEKISLKNDEKIILELKQTLQRLRRQKDDAQAKHSILQERLRQADQYKSLLMTSLDTERTKLISVLVQRVELAKKKYNLTEEITNFIQQEAMHSQSSSVIPLSNLLFNMNNNGDPPDTNQLQRPKIITKSSDDDSRNTHNLIISVKNRDSKGIPASSITESHENCSFFPICNKDERNHPFSNEDDIDSNFQKTRNYSQCIQSNLRDNETRGIDKLISLIDKSSISMTSLSDSRENDCTSHIVKKEVRRVPKQKTDDKISTNGKNSNLNTEKITDRKKIKKSAKIKDQIRSEICQDDYSCLNINEFPEDIDEFLSNKLLDDD